MKPGEHRTLKDGTEVYAASAGGCCHFGFVCMFDDNGGHGVCHRSRLDIKLECGPHNVIFVTKKQFLDMRILGLT